MQPHDTGGCAGAGGAEEAPTEEATTTAAISKVIQLRETECQFENGATPPVPFREIAGEEVQYVTTLPERGLLALSNYRTAVQQRGKQFHVPLGNLDSISAINDVSLVIMCKDGKSYGIKFHSAEHSALWLERLQEAIIPPASLEKNFAFKFYSQMKEFHPELHRIFISTIVSGLPSCEDTYEQRADKIFDMEVCWL
ncbi:PH domain-like [Trinorchestia longiramus]|nr:PH domain-like [Trinorchestia longiramus]